MSVNSLYKGTLVNSDLLKKYNFKDAYFISYVLTMYVIDEQINYFKYRDKNYAVLFYADLEDIGFSKAYVDKKIAYLIRNNFIFLDKDLKNNEAIVYTILNTNDNSIHLSVLNQIYNMVNEDYLNNYINNYNQRHYVYIVEQDDDNDWYKIGYTTSPNERLKSLQTSNPFNLSYLYLFSVSESLRTEFEFALHVKYAKKRGNGEWFKLTKNDIKEMIKYICHEEQDKLVKELSII